MADLKAMSVAALGAVSLAVTDLVGIAIVTQMKNNALVDNTTADLFISGLVLFGTFMAIIVLVIVGSLVIKLIRGSFGGN